MTADVETIRNRI